MKVKQGINPDYADFDELDEDAADILEGFGSGRNSYEELVALVGREEAERIAAMLGPRYDDEFTGLFDNPEDFSIDE